MSHGFFLMLLNCSMTVECLIDEVSGLFCVYSHWIICFSLSAEAFIDVAINFQLFNYVSFVKLNCCFWLVFILFQCRFLHFSVEL